MRFISRFGRFHEDFTLKEGTVPLPFSRNRHENHSHNLGKALGEGLGWVGLALYPFRLSIPFASLSLSLSLSISLLSHPPSLYLSFYLPFSLSPSLSLLSIFSLAYLMDVFVLVNHSVIIEPNLQYNPPSTSFIYHPSCIETHYNEFQPIL